MTREQQVKEWYRCKRNFTYFAEQYCKIYDGARRRWIPFVLWPEQKKVGQMFIDNQFVAALKARQLGITWLGLAYMLWQMIFHSVADNLLFSKNDRAAKYIIGKQRLKGMYRRLPVWMKPAYVIKDNVHEFQLSNGSITQSLITADGFTATNVMIDEADLHPDLGDLITSAGPTVDMGGKLLLVSKSNKKKPNSLFKSIYKLAAAGRNEYASIFLPYDVHPERKKPGWWETKAHAVYEETGSYDRMYENYPRTAEEALTGLELDKRFPTHWLDECYAGSVDCEVEQLRPFSRQELEAKSVPRDILQIPGLRIYHLPDYDGEVQKGEARFVAGADPAEGNPHSDDSALVMRDAETGEEVASFNARIEMDQFARHIHAICNYYNDAGVLVERNNHGNRVIGYLFNNTYQFLIRSRRDNKHGWNQNAASKVDLADGYAECLRTSAIVTHTQDIYLQARSIDGGTNRAPEGSKDDLWIADMLSCKAMEQSQAGMV